MLIAASNECKRRKIKCNGQTPCQRCGNLGLECLYSPNCCNSFKDSEYVTIFAFWETPADIGAENSSRYWAKSQAFNSKLTLCIRTSARCEITSIQVCHLWTVHTGMRSTCGNRLSPLPQPVVRTSPIRSRSTQNSMVQQAPPSVSESQNQRFKQWA